MEWQKTKDKLDAVSPTFCLAKWMQVTTTLYNGMTHSCHHPGQHSVPIDALKTNPTALHNTPIKLFARDELLKGIQTKECDYCWRIENLKNDGMFSDRVYKSAEYWASENFQNVLDSGIGENITPSYFEVAFDNTCSLACHYCLPEISSKILNETEKFGPYQLKNKTQNDIQHLHQKKAYPIRNHEYNPYIEAFWKWWPELRTTLKVFRITGGEPLLSKHTWKVIDDLIENPNLNLEFAINTNLSVPQELIDKFLSKIPQLSKSVKQFTVYTSAEAVGEALEYSRFGLIWTDFERNCHTTCSIVKDQKNCNFVVMTTVNILSMTTFTRFLDFIAELKNKYSNTSPHKIAVSFNFLRHPEFSCLTNLSKEKKQYYSNLLLNYDMSAFNQLEQEQCKRLVAFMNSCEANPTEQENFKLFFNEYDKRRNTQFSKIFNELL